MAEPQCKPLPILPQKEIDRFWLKIDMTPGLGPTGECWEWKGTRDDNGYGVHKIKRVQYRSHRIAYFLQHNEDPGPLCVCHRCDWPPCERGTHLFKGTNKENTDDRHNKGRTSHGETHHSRQHPELRPRGERHYNASFTEEDIRAIRTDYASGLFMIKSLAQKYGRSRSTIGGIVRQTSWRHVK